MVRRSWRLLLVVSLAFTACSGSTGETGDSAAATPKTENSTPAAASEPSPVPVDDAVDEDEAESQLAENDAAEAESTAPADAQESRAEATAAAPVVRVPENPGTVVATNWLARTAMDADSVDLVWSDVEGANVYRLYRQLTAEADYDAITAGDLAGTTLVYEGTETDWVDREPESGEFLTYVLVAQVGNDLTEPRWTEALTVDDTEPPSPIEGLVAELTDEGVLLQWDPATDNVEFASYSVSLMDRGELQYIGGGADESQTTFLDPCLLYTSPSPRDATLSRMPSSA